jgi:S1-C subfamily serine protease
MRISLIVLFLGALFSVTQTSGQGAQRSHNKVKTKPAAFVMEAPAPMTIEQISTKMRASVVAITVKDRNGNPIKYGSGVVISDNAVVTCYHVLEGGSSFTVNFSNGNSAPVYGVWCASRVVDLAVICVNTASVEAASYFNSALRYRLGAEVVAIGSPEGLSGTVSSGIVSSIRNETSRTLIQTTAPISPGSSGGGLFDMYGNLIGITSNYMPDGENLNFAISAWDLWSVEAGIDDSMQDVADIFGTTPDGQSTATPTPATEPAFTDNPLNGVVGVAVVVGDPGSDAAADGVTDTDLKNQVELELRKNGVPVDDPEKWSDGHGYIYVEPTMCKLASGDYAYSIDVSFTEPAILSRITPVRTFVETWETGYTGYVQLGDTASTISDETLKSVDSFSNAYLAQNPKN